MIRIAIALATALTVATPADASDRIGENPEARLIEQTAAAKPAKSKKPKKVETDASDYLIITFKEVLVSG